MFTGIIEGLAKIDSVSKAKKSSAAAIKLSIDLGKIGRGLRVGDSVCINGACLTATRISKGKADFEMVAETVRRTALGSVKPGDTVNIERSLRLGDRLEGHFVLGHVDGTAVIEDTTRSPNEVTVWFRVGKGEDSNTIMKSLVSKGSIAVDGISLTVVDVDVDNNRFSVSLIPHTLKTTTLGRKAKGERVNIETDVLSKYILRQLPIKQ